MSIDSLISFNQEVFTQQKLIIHQAYFALKVDNQGHLCYIYTLNVYNVYPLSRKKTRGFTIMSICLQLLFCDILQL